MFQVDLSNKSKKFYAHCDQKLFSRLKELFAVLEQTPVPAKDYDLRKISGEEETYCIRLSSYRVIYRVDWNQKLVFIARIERKDDSTYNF